MESNCGCILETLEREHRILRPYRLRNGNRSLLIMGTDAPQLPQRVARNSAAAFEELLRTTSAAATARRCSRGFFLPIARRAQFTVLFTMFRLSVAASAISGKKASNAASDAALPKLSFSTSIQSAR
jgi:hypothetical protein